MNVLEYINTSHKVIYAKDDGVESGQEAVSPRDTAPGICLLLDTPSVFCLTNACQKVHTSGQPNLPYLSGNARSPFPANRRRMNPLIDSSYDVVCSNACKKRAFLILLLFCLLFWARSEDVTQKPYFLCASVRKFCQKDGSYSGSGAASHRWLSVAAVSICMPSMISETCFGLFKLEMSNGWEYRLITTRNQKIRRSGWSSDCM